MVFFGGGGGLITKCPTLSVRAVGTGLYFVLVSWLTGKMRVVGVLAPTHT